MTADKHTQTDRQTDTLIKILRSPIGGGGKKSIMVAYWSGRTVSSSLSARALAV